MVSGKEEGKKGEEVEGGVKKGGFFLLRKISYCRLPRFSAGQVTGDGAWPSLRGSSACATQRSPGGAFEKPPDGPWVRALELYDLVCPRLARPGF